jgi:LmbE family N-acetylglucosaminyl deacetylase
MINQIKEALVIVAHPDDETIGMGGTLHRLMIQGSKIDFLFLSSGVGSRNLEPQSKYLREMAARKAVNRFGSRNLQFHDFPDNQFDSIGLLPLVKEIEKFLLTNKYDTVFTNSRFDLNIDHKLTAEATLTACRPQNNLTVRNIFHFETLSSSEWNFGNLNFKPEFFVDITTSINYKIEALMEYNQEMREFPHPRSVRAVTALSQVRGSQIGVCNAEAFQISYILS